MKAYATTSGPPARNPGDAIEDLAHRLADPMWDGWELVDGSVTVEDFGLTEWIATAKLEWTINFVVKRCIHLRDPEQCTECNPF